MPRKPKPTHHRVEVTVCGSGAFPVDMLRYDQCAPRTSGDAACVAQRDGSEFRVVNLNAYSAATETSRTMTAERWESFGWYVLTDEELVAYRCNPSIDAVKDLRAVIQGRETAAGRWPRDPTMGVK